MVGFNAAMVRLAAPDTVVVLRRPKSVPFLALFKTEISSLSVARLPCDVPRAVMEFSVARLTASHHNRLHHGTNSALARDFRSGGCCHKRLQHGTGFYQA